ncbi:hypothetical protein JCM24511_05790 [Saitozyma sp. JCM 24511]|nr:hypothetical protein JCM24511_05790 [Saitozyma sp. JCM 24511]
MAPQRDETPAWKVAGVVGFYMAVALIMVMTNKWVLTTNSLPLTFLFLQLSLAVVCLLGLSCLPESSPFAFRPPRWTRSTVFALLPVCTANVVGLVFNIFCLQLVDASYFQVARGLTLPMTVVLSAITSRENPTREVIISCGLVTWGFTYSFIPVPWMSSSTPSGGVMGGQHGGVGGGEAPILGMILGVFSAAMVAIHAVLVKSALRHVEGRALDLAYWQNAISAIALIPAILISGEVWGLLRLLSGTEGELGAFVSGSLITGIVGFLICVAGVLSIKVTSPVTHMFSAAVRSVLQTILGVQLFGDVINASRIISILLILLGSLSYTYHKSRPAKPSPGGTGSGTAPSPSPRNYGQSAANPPKAGEAGTGFAPIPEDESEELLEKKRMMYFSSTNGTGNGNGNGNGDGGGYADLEKGEKERD